MFLVEDLPRSQRSHRPPQLCSLHVAFGGAIGASARLTVGYPHLAGPLGVHAWLDVPIFFSPGLALGGGLSAGLFVAVAPWIEPFAEAGVRRFFAVPAGFRSDYVLIEAGIRLRRP